MADRPCRRVVRTFDVDARALQTVRLEVNDAGMRHGRAFDSFPRNHVIRFEPGDDRVEFDWHAAGTCNGPMRLPFDIRRAHLADVRHEAWKVFEVAPEIEHGRDGRTNVDRLLNIDGATPRSNANEPLRFEIRGGAKHERRSRKSEERS